MKRIDDKIAELERDWGFDPHVEIDDSWGAATMRAYGAYTTLLWVREQLRRRGIILNEP